MKTKFEQFNDILKEHYIKPLSVFYRELYLKKFNEEPPEDMDSVLDRLIKSGEEDIIEIINASRKGD